MAVLGAWLIAWLWAVGLTLAGAGLLGGFFWAVQGGGRTSGWAPLLILTVPLAVASGLIGLSLWSWRRESFWLPALVGAMLGATFGFLWTVAVVIVLGPSFDAFSLPVIWCWMGGGALGAAVPPLPAPGRWRAGLLVGALLLAIAGILGTPRVSALLAQAHAVELVFIQWEHGGGPLQIQGDRAALTEAEVAELRSTGLTGAMRVASRVRHGRGPTSRLVVVLDGAPQAPIHLALPEDAAVLYIVGPAGPQLLTTKVKLQPHDVIVETKGSQIWYRLDGPGGPVTANAFPWQ